jgi:hypothetical protein
MTTLRTALLAAPFALLALPAAAGGFVFDLPRLTFPEPTDGVTRDCQVPTLGSPATCAPGNS